MGSDSIRVVISSRLTDTGLWIYHKATEKHLYSKYMLQNPNTIAIAAVQSKDYQKYILNEYRLLSVACVFLTLLPKNKNTKPQITLSYVFQLLSTKSWHGNGAMTKARERLWLWRINYG